MNAYIAVAAVLCVSFIAIGILRSKYRDRVRGFCLIDSTFAVCGVILAAVSLVLMFNSISGADEEFADWLRDMLTVFFAIDLPVFAVLILAIFVPAFMAWVDKKLRFGFSYAIRQISSVFAPAFIMIIGGFYSVVINNSTVDSAVYLRLFTLGEALIFRAVSAVEYRSCLLDKANVKKK